MEWFRSSTLKRGCHADLNYLPYHADEALEPLLYEGGELQAGGKLGLHHLLPDLSSREFYPLSVAKPTESNELLGSVFNLGSDPLLLHNIVIRN